MHEILTTTRANLTDRAAELESLIKAGEEQCQAIADEGNRQIKVITDKAGADIGGINAELEKYVTELAGVQHSIGTIDDIANIENERQLSAQSTTVGVPLNLSGLSSDTPDDANGVAVTFPMPKGAIGATVNGAEATRVTPINNSTPMTEAAAGAAMQRLQHEDDRQQAADPYTNFISGKGLPEKKKP